MVFAFTVQGTTIIVTGFVKGGKLKARINRARILAALGIPETACVSWGIRR